MPHPLLARVPRSQMTERLQREHDASLALRDDATLIEVGANAPELLEWYRDSFYARLFYGGRVDVRTKELMRYRLSMTHGCAYCNRGNSKAALKAGVTETQLANIMNENDPVFDARDRAVLRQERGLNWVARRCTIEQKVRLSASSRNPIRIGLASGSETDLSAASTSASR